MKTTMKGMITAIILMGSLNSFAGAGGGNGGGVHHCPNRAVKTEFYDLYEGRESWDLITPSYNGLSVDQILETGLAKIATNSPRLAKMIEGAVIQAKSMITIKSNKKLSRVDDADILMVDKDCSYEQLANWYEPANKIFVDESLFLELSKDNLNYSAFIMHEAAYKVSRNTLDAKDSNEVRKFVAEVFSTSVITAKIAPKLRDNIFTIDGTSLFYTDYAYVSFDDPACDQGVYFEVRDVAPQFKYSTNNWDYQIVPSVLTFDSSLYFKSINKRESTIEFALTIKSTSCNESYSLKVKGKMDGNKYSILAKNIKFK